MMKISKILLKTTILTLDAIFKASEADIRLHDIKNIPKDQPVLFLLNHFTRLETTFFPYILAKQTGKYSLSLAHHSLFAGKFGKIMEKVGAVSTNDPDRDKLFISNMLTGKLYTIIFPEGQMIKDKKIIEKGKFMVYNMGIRRSPHTGAARLALRAQFYREKIKDCIDKGKKNELDTIKNYFGFSDNDIRTITGKETFIVPCNITYYPIRAKNNAIKKLVEKFTKNISFRFEEELEVEGTMIMEGVDIDINFGKPIRVRDYLYKSRDMVKRISDDQLYLLKDEAKKELPMRKISIDLMQVYMSSIYGMTTVNHDHIFAYLLASSLSNKINEHDFKNRANRAIARIKKLNINNFHTSLGEKQNTLHTDEFNAKYESFIEAALSDNLIHFDDGYIYRNKKKFSMPYVFHEVRQDNIVEVLKNEIEPLENLMRMLRRTMWVPSFWVRRQIRRTYLNLDGDLFEKDYKEFFIEGETKPESIGRPFFMKKFFQKKGVIIVHGYMAAPEEVRPLAEFLHKNGFAVYCVRLRGHGTSPEDLANRDWEEWYDSVNRGYIIMKNSVKKFAVIGFSTGAGLALMQAANKGKKLKGVISINAPLRLQNIASHLSSAMVMWNTVLKKMQVKKGKIEFVANNPDNPHINYFRNPVKGIRQLEKLMDLVEDKLKEISIPSLIVQGTHDPVVNPDSAHDIYDLIGTLEKELYFVESNRHGILRGEESDPLNKKILEFLTRIF